MCQISTAIVSVLRCLDRQLPISVFNIIPWNLKRQITAELNSLGLVKEISADDLKYTVIKLQLCDITSDVLARHGDEQKAAKTVFLKDLSMM